jgi:hypothetical protein
MRRKIYALLIVATLFLPGTRLEAEPPARSERKTNSDVSTKTTSRDLSRARLLESANGWMFVNNEWVHPDGYKFVNNRVLRTTAKAGKAFPKPPGKLALENPTKLTARPNSTGAVPKEPQTAAEKAAETRRKNLTPAPAPQTGTHL